VDFDTLLAQSDIVSVHSPLTEKTHHLMNYDAFCKMKKSAVFVNVARGPIVVEADLVKALKEKQIAAAALDVLEQEPMIAENPLHELKDCDRLLITPHIAWAPVETRRRLLDEVWENISAFQRGEERNVCTG
jgi:glycerate dehydrogenase